MRLYIIGIALLFIIFASLGAVGFFASSTASSNPKNKIKVVTSFTILADMAQNVAGDKAVVVSITKYGAEIHDYQPTPKDLIRVQDADVILWNGLNLERWFERFLQETGPIPAYTLSDGIIPLSLHGGDYDGKPNPHGWMSLKNAAIYIENIRKALCAVDPENTEAYTRNAETYLSQINTLRDDLLKTIKNIPQNKRVLTTSEGAFSYLAKDLDMDELYIWPMNAEQQGSAQQVRRVIDTIRARKIPVIFSESTVSDKPARQIAQETGIHYGGVLYVDSLSEKNGPVPTYFDLLRATTTRITEGFSHALPQEKIN